MLPFDTLTRQKQSDYKTSMSIVSLLIDLHELIYYMGRDEGFDYSIYVKVQDSD